MIGLSFLFLIRGTLLRDRKKERKSKREREREKGREKERDN